MGFTPSSGNIFWLETKKITPAPCLDVGGLRILKCSSLVTSPFNDRLQIVLIDLLYFYFSLKLSNFPERSLQRIVQWKALKRTKLCMVFQALLFWFLFRNMKMKFCLGGGVALLIIIIIIAVAVHYRYHDGIYIGW